MEKKKMKLWKKILLVILIIIGIIVIHTTRNFIIFSQLDNKVNEKENHSNYSVIRNTPTTTTITYKYNDIRKDIITKKDNCVSIIQITKPAKRIFITKDENQTTRNEYEDNDDTWIASEIIPNYTNFYTITEKLISSIGSTIKCEKHENTDYYVISGMNTNFIYDANSTDLKIYIEKDTGLLKQIRETINDNGNVCDNIYTYTYEFGNVTEEMMEEE